MDLETTTITLHANPNYEDIIEKNRKTVLDFAQSLAEEWMQQALYSLIFEPTFGHYDFLRISQIQSLELEEGAITITYTETYPTLGMTADLHLAPIGNLEERTETIEIPMVELRKYSFEGNGYSQPDLTDPVIAQYPKWHYIKQAAEGGWDDGEYQYFFRRISPETDSSGLISRLLIKGKRATATLTSATLDELPLNETEEAILADYTILINTYHKIREKKSQLYEATDGTLHSLLGWNDFIQFGYPKALLGYLSASTRLAIKLKPVIVQENDVRVEFEESSMGLLQYAHALSNQINMAKAHASFITTYDRGITENLLSNADHYIQVLDDAIVEHGLE